MLAQDYPDFEVIAVNDRSTDLTLQGIKAFEKNPRLKVLNVSELPDGWLGKNHALYQGYRASRGEWILFTDADVVFDKGTLMAAVKMAKIYQLDHLVLFPKLIFKSWIEIFFSHSFLLAFFRRYRPWAARNARSKNYIGIGAFNFLRRSVYEKIGTHQKLAFEVLDDMELGKLVKQGGFKQMAAFGKDFISVRWVEGWQGVMKSLEKNAFAGVDFSIMFLLMITTATILFDVLPFVLVFFAHGTVFKLCLATLFYILGVYLATFKTNHWSLLIFPFHSVGFGLLLVVIWRSALRVIKEGGIRWRDTFYPLNRLRRS